MRENDLVTYTRRKTHSDHVLACNVPAQIGKRRALWPPASPEGLARVLCVQAIYLCLHV